MSLKDFFRIERKQNIREVDKLADVVLDLKEIAESIFEKIDRKIQELKEIEQRLDEKIRKIEMLISSENQAKISKNAFDKRNEIVKMFNSGMDPKNISKILGISSGEVELIINLYKLNTNSKK